MSTGSRMLVTFQSSAKQKGHKGFSASYEGIRNFQTPLIDLMQLSIIQNSLI